MRGIWPFEVEIVVGDMVVSSVLDFTVTFASSVINLVANKNLHVSPRLVTANDRKATKIKIILTIFKPETFGDHFKYPTI